MGFFKSKEQKEQERNIKIHTALAKQRRNIKELEKHEKGYMEKALRAKRNGDDVNYKQLCGMIARTINIRRAVESQLLKFETMLQARDQAQMMKEFAVGMKEMSKSIGDACKEFNATQIMHSFEEAINKHANIEMQMDMVLDQISSYEEDATVPEGGLSPESIAKILDDKVASEDSNVDKQIENGLAAIRQSLKQVN
ncbi:MAG: hypothetical protein LBB88_06755 [Planctomycetaceae bacterium]|jgi:hypothetical protein|nr:hypothetical protein [Planctomycetaceae bacterium]